MIGVCVLAWVLMMIGSRVTKRDGVLLVVLWIASVIILSGGDEQVAGAMSGLVGSWM